MPYGDQDGLKLVTKLSHLLMTYRGLGKSSHTESGNDWNTNKQLLAIKEWAQHLTRGINAILARMEISPSFIIDMHTCKPMPSSEGNQHILYRMSYIFAVFIRETISSYLAITNNQKK